MDTDLLKTFVEVCQTRHFGRAAENLYLTQAAVSSRIRQLESRIGVPVFTRLRNNLKLTPAGERLLPHAQAVLTAWQRAYQEVAISENQRQQIALGGSPNIWDLTLQNRLFDLKSHKPDMAVRAEVLSHNVVVRQLLERTLDLALVFDAPKVDELHTTQLFQLPLALVSTDANQDFASIKGMDYIMMDWGTLFNIQHAKQCATLPIPSLHTNLARVALDYMLQAGGAAYLPLTLCQAYIDKGILHLVENAPEMHRDVFASYHKENSQQTLIEEVINLFRQYDSQVAPSLQPTP
ncbi:LysR family transcriptional regulator [Bermanella marisrubri]|nr:LysR family transcriptional regulator [Bermanella marisrubri]QIZ83873.1 LysR family transcriptional regulator [Bermanella marisrubri]